MNYKILFALSFFIFFESNTGCFFKTCVSCDQMCDNKNDEDFVFGKTFFSVRPQDSNTVRRILTRHAINNYRINEFEKFNGNFTFEVQKSFNNNSLAEWFLFKNKRCLSIGVPGNNQKYDIDANQLGLAINSDHELKGLICFKPKIENYIFDFDFTFNLDCILCGLWTRFELPVVHAINSLGISVLKDNVKKETFSEGFFTLDCQSTQVPFKCVLQALDGVKPFGAVPTLDSGIFYPKDMKKTALAGIHFDLGYDIVANENSYLNSSLHIVFPTGTRPKGRYLFEPVIGANKSWQVGLTLNSGIKLLERSDANISFFMETVMTHLFKSKQTRLFNLNNGPLSFLLLLKEFDFTQEDLIRANRAANVFTGETKIGADFMFDGSWMLQISKCDLFINIGYNLWARTREKRDSTVCFRNFKENQFAIKGNTHLSNSQNFELCVGPSETICSPNLRTASESTISQPAEADENSTFIQISDIDFSSALHPTVITNKIFGTVGYNWNKQNHSGFYQIGAEVEFTSGNKAVKQWGLLFNFGIYL